MHFSAVVTNLTVLPAAQRSDPTFGTDVVPSHKRHGQRTAAAWFVNMDLQEPATDAAVVADREQNLALKIKVQSIDSPIVCANKARLLQLAVFIILVPKEMYATVHTTRCQDAQR